MMYNKDADNIFFLLSFTRCQREKNIERTFLVSAGAQKWWETGSGTTFLHYLPIQKINSK